MAGTVPIVLTVNVNEAKARLSKLIAAVENGEEVVIARAGRPAVKLTRLSATSPVRRLGLLSGKYVVPDDWDTPLPDSMLAAFEGS